MNRRDHHCSPIAPRLLRALTPPSTAIGPDDSYSHQGRGGLIHFFALGRTLDRTPVIALIHGYDIRIIHAATGETLRHLTLDPTHRYHGTGQPPGGPKRPYGPQKNKRPKPQ